MLGCVHETTSSELIVSLPGIGNFGHIKLNNISKVYTDLLKTGSDEVHSLVDMYKRGDYVRCKVLNYSDRRLHLSIEPDVVNAGLTEANVEAGMILSGAVKTREDHGFTIDLGIAGVQSGFMKTQEEDMAVSIGQCCLFKVNSKGRVVSLSLCQGLEICELKNKNQFDSFLPGTRLVNCTVERVAKNGLHLEVTKQINGYVHFDHLPASKRAKFGSKKSGDEKPYTNGEKLSATIIFVNPYSKIVYMSLLPHLNDSSKSARVARLLFEKNTDEPISLHIGQVVNDAQVNLESSLDTSFLL